MIGPKLPTASFKGLAPYGNVHFGFGSGSFLNWDTPVLAYGGVGYRLSKRFRLRVFDFEYQQWIVTPRLYPYGGNFGIAFKIF